MAQSLLQNKALVCGLNDAKTVLADIKGNLVIYSKLQKPSQTKEKTVGCRPEQSVSSQCIQGSYTHFHVNGHSGCFINILRTFH